MPATKEVQLGPAARAASGKKPRASTGRRAPTTPTSYGPEELRALFTLTPDDLTVVEAARKDETRLGLALLLVWARVEHRLVSDPAMLPPEVISFVASQLELPPDALVAYGKRPATRTAHVAAVCRHLGRDGLVETTWQESPSGPPRRYYELTPAGLRALEVFTEEWIRFTQAVDRLLREGERR